MNVVGFDLSLTSTGIAHADGTGAIKIHGNGPQRLVDLRDEILSWFNDVDLVAIEGYSYNSRNGGERIGELGGVIRVALHESEIPFVEVSPAAVKKYATGKGNANKDAVVAAIAARTGIAFGTSDECDAWILRAMALDHYGEPVVKMPELNRSALSAIEWPVFDAAAARPFLVAGGRGSNPRETK